MPHEEIAGKLVGTVGVQSRPRFKGNISLYLFFSIEDQYVPVEGDEVTFKKTLVPPKNEKYQAMHVKIVHLKEGTVHQRWDSPPLH